VPGVEADSENCEQFAVYERWLEDAMNRIKAGVR
jgi:hypothetical protein